MSEPTVQEDPKAGEQPPAPQDPSAETKKTDAPGPVPFERFSEVNRRMQDAEAKLKQLSDAAEQKRIADDKAARDKLADEGKAKDALTIAETELTELRPLKETVKAYETAIGDMLKTRMAGVPEPITKLLSAMKPLDALAWLNENADQIAPKKPPKTDAGETGDRKGDQTFSATHISKVMEELGFPSSK